MVDQIDLENGARFKVHPCSHDRGNVDLILSMQDSRDPRWAETCMTYSEAGELAQALLANSWDRS